MRAFLVSASMLLTVSAAALAQAGSITAGSAPAASDVSQGRLPSEFLRTAQSALTAGRNREAEEALEMAQTRMLDRSVPLGQTNNPSDNPIVVQITQARQALAARDRTASLHLIQTAIEAATSRGL